MLNQVQHDFILFFLFSKRSFLALLSWACRGANWLKNACQFERSREQKAQTHLDCARCDNRYARFSHSCPEPVEGRSDWTLIFVSSSKRCLFSAVSRTFKALLETLVSRTLVLSVSRGEVTEIVIADLQSVTLILNHFNSSPSSIKHLVFFKLITLKKCSIYWTNKLLLLGIDWRTWKGVLFTLIKN